jgi:hypothetical protein
VGRGSPGGVAWCTSAVVQKRDDGWGLHLARASWAMLSVSLLPRGGREAVTAAGDDRIARPVRWASVLIAVEHLDLEHAEQNHAAVAPAPPWPLTVSGVANSTCS